MLALLKQFEEKQPEIVFNWKDAITGAEGWLVINSLRNGSAGGGTRMRKGLDKHEVVSLAKTMEVKFTVSGPAIGGAKSGINFDPLIPRKKEVLERWFKAVMPLLKTYYGTGGDLNVDEVHEVIPITEKFGLHHPQEGTAVGHFGGTKEELAKRIERLQKGVSKIIEDKDLSPDVNKKYRVADMITGYGVSESVKHFYKIWNGESKGKRAIIQGWGNVAAAAGYYLAQQGIKIVGIIDRESGVINENGFSFEQVRDLFNRRKNNTLNCEGMLPAAEINEKIWEVPAEIFIPGAASRLVTFEQAETLIDNGLELISCGANVPFADKEIFFGPIAGFCDTEISVVPDFIANCGMARVFCYLHGNDGVIEDQAIFNDVSVCIANALKNVHAANQKKTHLSQAGLNIALQQLM